MQERLQKILAANGFGSRRKVEEFIVAGRVKVNGKIAELGQKADPDIDTIEMDDQPVKGGGTFLYYLLHKPIGVVCTNIGQDTAKKSYTHSQRINTVEVSGEKKRSGGMKPGTKTVRDLLPPELRGKIVTVGRLDKDSEGLLLLTNDGQLAQHLMHPKYSHEKEYEVEVDRVISDSALQQLKKGVYIDGEPTKPARVKRLSESKFSMAISEGRNRQIRRMCEKIGYIVMKLKRVRIVTLGDRSLAAGSLRPLLPWEVDQLREAVGLLEQ